MTVFESSHQESQLGLQTDLLINTKLTGNSEASGFGEIVGMQFSFKSPIKSLEMYSFLEFVDVLPN